MPITVTCNCGKQLRAPEQAAGKKVRCPACQSVLRVPAADLPGPEDTGGRTPKPEPVAEKPTRPSVGRDDPAPHKAAPNRQPDDLPPPDEDDENPSPRTGRKRADRGDRTRPPKKRSTAKTLLLVGALGMLGCCTFGGGGIGIFFYYLHTQEAKVTGKWVVDPAVPENAKLPLVNRSMELEFGTDDNRAVMRSFGVEFSGKWHVNRHGEGGSVRVVVDLEEGRRADGQKLQGKAGQPFTVVFELTPVDADHADVVDVSEKDVRMRMKRVGLTDPTAGKQAAAGTTQAGK